MIMMPAPLMIVILIPVVHTAWLTVTIMTLALSILVIVQRVANMNRMNVNMKMLAILSNVSILRVVSMMRLIAMITTHVLMIAVIQSVFQRTVLVNIQKLFAMITMNVLKTLAALTGVAYLMIFLLIV
jgi:hypothetical protein